MIDDDILAIPMNPFPEARQKTEFESLLAARLAGRVEAAYLFGSLVTGSFGPESDVDIILVVRTDKPFTKRALDFLDLPDLFPAMDILVYTPEEFERLTHAPTAGFWATVTAEMKRIV